MRPALLALLAAAPPRLTTTTLDSPRALADELVADFGRPTGRAANGRAAGVLNAFCNDSAHGAAHASSRNVPLAELQQLGIRSYRGCAAFADEGVPQLLGRIGVVNAQHVVSDSFGYPGILCVTDGGRKIAPGCMAGTPLPSPGCDCPWPGDGGNWSLWEGVVTRLAERSKTLDVIWDVWNVRPATTWLCLPC